MAKATSSVTEFISGTLYWAKIFGAPRPNYGGDANEWTFELVPDEAGIATLEKHGLTDRLKTDKKDPERGKYIVLKKSELKKDGTPNTHIRVYNEANEKWPDDTMIGNGSRGDVKVNIADYGVGKFKGIYPSAIRVTELVKYASSEFGAMDDASGGSAKPAAKVAAKDRVAEDFGTDNSDVAKELDDDVPF